MISDCILLPACWYNSQVHGAYLLAFALAQYMVSFSNEFCEFDEACICEATDTQLNNMRTEVLKLLADITRVLEINRACYPVGNADYYIIPPEPEP